ncbi:uncharacterized protein DUF4328 [Streptomyces sp. 1114.5]|uniref:DUF4328 domain-containing protein n=1 Tax=Streptomyces sp. 1114.5 TaxID=1938830 RepID=UPI000EB3217F|nr:DUF4328 domain-containing protein [Streptomyces sp. 1114.5]RKT11499.1 uncharacterized protein DUF4328 [Streptomyces sp. 1114.5]
MDDPHGGSTSEGGKFDGSRFRDSRFEGSRFEGSRFEGTRTAGTGARQHRALSGLGVAASILIVLVLVYDVLHAVSDWQVYNAVEDVLAGTATDSQIQAADDFGRYFDGLQELLFLIPAGVVFLVWLWRARANAESLGGPGSQRRARGWAVFSWITPVANLWIPYQVVTDIWKAGRPRRPVPGPLLAVWWGAWVIGGYVGRAYTYEVTRDTFSEDDLRRAVYLGTVFVVLNVLAGVLIVYAIRQISVWQTQRSAEALR